ncbi:type IIL restriction-modification enzyme MmeI [Aminivibrio sp.]|uniref:class I SAM-dependent DNA methyltransferase n=1 Tax=Aminivibrio sp. TaxID=1872489 RepID=UPI001A3E1663|nr:type IIL restriction-modification enzyme MmeI [Aminivibrio sp.]MBL3539236.1 hypothetical protein [Aminivibrio sp.]
MTIDYDKVQSDVKELGYIADNNAFLEGFLSAFNFPKATFARLEVETKNSVNQGVRIQGNGNIFFLASIAENLNSEFNILKKNDLSKIREAFIIIVNETDLLAYERDSGDVLETSKVELFRYIEFFFPLLGIMPETANDEMRSADIKTAVKFAELYNALSLENHNHSDEIAEFLCRFLFCCFADSIGVLTNGGLRPLLANYTDVSGSDTSTFFCYLFEAMKSKSPIGLPGYFSNVRYIDARLFSNASPLLDFNQAARNLMLDLLGLDWSEITAEILGALIQSIIRPDSRSSGGNYTSTANIQKVIGPLFMEDLYRAFDRVKASREECATLLKRVRLISVFDPSCGAGNFLLTAYKELNKLAGKIIDTIKTTDKAAVLGCQSSSLPSDHNFHSQGTFSLIPLGNFYGIDDDPFSCAIARLGFVFVVCQEARKSPDIKSVFGEAVNSLFSNNIVTGNATRIDWETVCGGKDETYLIGNPPYIGARKQNQAQKGDLRHVFAGYTKISDLDYVACWFMLATKYICAHGGGFAFVTTNSLTQGQQVQLLWPKLFEKGVRISFAHTSFKWKNDARNRTAVTVVIIGVTPITTHKPCELYTPTTVYSPNNISPYLTAGETIVERKRLPISQIPKMVKGNMPLYWSDYFLNHEEKVDLVSREPGVRKFLKKIVGADEFINGIERWCFWIHDEDLEEAKDIPYITERIECVRRRRLASSDNSARAHAAHPHRFRENRETTKNSLVIPSVSSENREYIPIGFVDKNVVVTNLAFLIYDCEPWIFGVIASKMHNVWIRTVCGALETRIRYSSELGYNTFPFPDVSEARKTEITRRVFDVIEAREKFPGLTFAQLYDPGDMPPDLRFAHHLLDLVIDSCYRDAPFVSDKERLEVLFDLYTQLRG